MKKMKKLLVLMTCAFVLFGTAACSSRDNADNGADQSATDNSATDNNKTDNNTDTNDRTMNDATEGDGILDDAVRQLRFVEAKILGFVMTGADTQKKSYKRYGKSYGDYKQHSASGSST